MNKIFLRRGITVNAFSVFQSKLIFLGNKLSVIDFMSDINESTYSHSLLFASIWIFKMNLLICLLEENNMLFLRLLYWYELPIILFCLLSTRYFIKLCFCFSWDWCEVDQPNHPYFSFCMLFHHQHTSRLLESQAEMIPCRIFSLVCNSNTYFLLILAKFFTPGTSCFNELSYLHIFCTTFQCIKRAFPIHLGIDLNAGKTMT